RSGCPDRAGAVGSGPRPGHAARRCRRRRSRTTAGSRSGDPWRGGPDGCRSRCRRSPRRGLPGRRGRPARPPRPSAGGGWLGPGCAARPPAPPARCPCPARAVSACPSLHGTDARRRTAVRSVTSTMGRRAPLAAHPVLPCVKGRPMIRLSSSFIRTLREDPADAEVASHKLLVRAGYIRRSAAGVYTWLPLGLKVLRKVEQIVREEQDAIGGQEVLFSALQPREPYEATGRWEDYGPNLFRLQDRKQDDYLLAPTHEEMFTLTVKDLFSSYKDLPTMLYQIQAKYRDEARPRAGLLR